MIVLAIVSFIAAVVALIGCARALKKANEKDIVIGRYIVALEDTSKMYMRLQKRVEELERENNELRAKSADKNK